LARADLSIQGRKHPCKTPLKVAAARPEKEELGSRILILEAKWKHPEMHCLAV